MNYIKIKNQSLKAIYKHILEIESFTRIITCYNDNDFSALESEDFINTISLINEKINIIKNELDNIVD